MNPRQLGAACTAAGGVLLCYPIADTLAGDKLVTHSDSLRPIIVYMVRQHPLEKDSPRPPFRWLHTENDFRRQLEKLIGPFDDTQLSMIVDDLPAGPGWGVLLQALGEERVRMVVTHLAPLTPAQRQQLIGVCAETGARLVTPADAGRNRLGTAPLRRL